LFEPNHDIELVAGDKPPRGSEEDSKRRISPRGRRE
jgi:hypothetical protein